MTLSIKKLTAYTIAALSLVLMSGCSNLSDKTNSTNTNTNINNKKETSAVSDVHTDAAADNSSSTADETKNHDSNSSKTQKQDNSQKTLLESIKNLSDQGKVINCDFPVKINISDIETKWGKADASDYISAAKGIYYTYSKHNVVFGCNKGDQIFEIRSFDSKLNKISISDVKEYFGTPAHDVKVSDEEVIGYVIGEEFKIEFVFPQYKNSTKIPMLKHYNILYPNGTINNMSGDPGRKW